MEQRQEDVIERYMAILAHGEQMLANADNQAWEDLIAREGRYLAEIEQLAELEQHVQLDAKRLEMKHHLLVNIRDTEQKLCGLLQAQLTHLSEVMEQSRNEMRVKQAYGPSVVN